MGNCNSNSSLPVEPPVSFKSPSKKKKRSIPKSLKRAIWDVYIGAEKGTAACLCCERTQIRQIEFHCGHVIAEANGGTLTVENLRPICAQCNLSMGKQNLFDFKHKFFPPASPVVEKEKKKSRSTE